jgi:hypothetical protein
MPASSIQWFALAKPKVTFTLSIKASVGELLNVHTTSEIGCSHSVDSPIAL